MMNEQIDVKIIRLVTGEDIVGLCLYDDENDFVDIENPMKILLKRSTDKEQTALILSPWLPFEIIDDNSARISNNDIITFITPKQTFIEYYIHLMDKFEEASLEDENDEDSDLFSSHEEIYSGMEDDDQMDDYFSKNKEDNKRKLH